MSFILQDKNLLDYLVKVAQQEKPAPINRDIISGYEAATKLLYKLQSGLGDNTAPKATVPIGSEEPIDPENAQLKVANLRTLGDFIKWLHENKITWDDKRIAWSVDEREAEPNDPEISKAWMFSSLPFDRNDRRIDRQPISVSAYANKDRLIAYLTYLRDTPESRENKVFQFMIGTLLGEVNGFLRAKGEKPVETKPAPTGKVEGLDPGIVIDVVPSTLDPANPFDGLDEHPFSQNKDQSNWLQYSDILTPSAFSSWLRGRKVKVTKGDQVEEVDVLSATGDPCLLLHILYKRAVRLGQISKGDDTLVPNYTKAVEQYIVKVQEYGKSFTGADGRPCQVTVEPTSAQRGGKPGEVDEKGKGKGRRPGGGEGGEGEGRGGRPDQRTIDLIAEIVMKFPLHSAGVSFEKIATFCTAIKQLNYSPWNEMTDKITSNIRQAQQILTTKSPTSLRDGIEFNIDWGRDSKGQYINPFANNFDLPGHFCHYMRFIENIVADTASLISKFRNMYQKHMTPAQYAIATEQVGTVNSSVGSAYFYNKNGVNSYRTRASCPL